MLHVFAIYDKRTETFGDPFSVAHPEIARRGFEEATETPNSYISKNPTDYVLYKVGTFDQNSALLVALDPPIVFAQNKPQVTN